MNVFELTAAVRPSAEFVSQAREQIKEKVGKDTKLELKIDPSITGGAVISCKGYYFNFSLKKQLNEYFEKNKNKIEKLIFNF